MKIIYILEIIIALVVIVNGVILYLGGIYNLSAFLHVLSGWLVVFLLCVNNLRDYYR